MNMGTSPPVAAVRMAAHWVILVLCAIQFPTSAAIHRTHQVNPFGLPPSDLDLLLHKVHAVSGWGILVLAALLAALRWRGAAPPLSRDLPTWQRRLAVSVRLLLYAMLAGLVVTGTATMYLSRDFAVPHGILVKVGIALVGLHTFGALWHQFVTRDRLVETMMPSPLLRLFRRG